MRYGKYDDDECVMLENAISNFLDVARVSGRWSVRVRESKTLRGGGEERERGS